MVFISPFYVVCRAIDSVAMREVSLEKKVDAASGDERETVRQGERGEELF